MNLDLEVTNITLMGVHKKAISAAATKLWNSISKRYIPLEHTLQKAFQ